MLYFWNPDYSLIPNMMIDTSPWSSCSRRSPWSPWLLCSVHKISSTGPSVSPLRDFSSVCVFKPHSHHWQSPLALKGWEEGRELHLIFSLRHSAIVAIRLPLFLDLLHTLSSSSCALHNSNLWQKYGFGGEQIVPSCHPGWENMENMENMENTENMEI